MVGGFRDITALARTRPVIVGVLNVTPDSFSDGGLHLEPAAAVARARAMVAEGADLVEVGGESTAPGRRPLAAADEWRRIEPVITALAGEIPLVVDTYHAETAARALAQGVWAINDVSALRAEPALAQVVAQAGGGLVLMHAKDAPLPHASERPAHYGDVVAEIASFLEVQARRAVAAGVAADAIVLDPGWGRFISLDPEDSFTLLRRFRELVARLAPFPVMVAVSRKGFLGGPMEERDALSQLAALHAVEQGARFIRTHRPAMMRRFLELARRLGRPIPA